MTAAAHRLHHLTRGLGRPLAVGAGALLALAGAPVGVDGPTICPFALITGTACPGCGMSRALVALGHGDLGLAWTYHPLVGLVAVQLVIAFAWWAALRAGFTDRRPGRGTVIGLALTGVALVAVWLLRWSAGTLPPV